MRLHLFFVFFAWASLCGLSEAQIPKVASPLPFVAPITIAYDKPYQVGNADGGALWLLRDDQVSLADAARYHRSVQKIVSVAGLESAGEIDIEFDPGYQKVIMHHLLIIRDGQSLNALQEIRPSLMQRESLWERRMLDGRTTALYILRDIRVGDIIDVAYTIQGENPVFNGRQSGRQYLGFGIPLVRRHFRIVAPEDRPIQFTRSELAPPYVSSIVPEGMAYVWDIHHPPASMPEAGTPAWHIPYPRIDWSEFRDWTEVVQWAQQTYVLPENHSAALTRLTSSWTQLNPEDQLAEALRFVQDSVRYLGMEMGAYSHAPRHPDSILSRRFGDCKEKTLLFCTLLKRMGIQAEPVLINTWAGATLVDMNASPLAFDHVIARVHWQGQRLYFDPTLTHQRGRPSQIDPPAYAYGLPVADAVYGPLALDPPINAHTHVAYDFKIESWDKPGKVRVRTVYSGQEADRVRREWSSSHYADIAKSYRDYLGRFYQGLRSTDSVRFDDNTVQNQVTTTESYAIDSLCQAAENGLSRQCEFLPVEINHAVAAPDPDSRKTPYALSWPRKISTVIKLELPEDYGALRSQGRADHPDFLYSWNEYGLGNRHTLEYRYEALSDHVPASRYQDYVREIASIRNELGVGYPAESSQDSAFGGRLNSFWILYMALCIAASIACARYLIRMQPLKAHRADGSALAIFQKTPRRIGGWLGVIAFGLVLGWMARAWELKDLLPYFNHHTWNNLTSSEGRAYHPAWEPLLIFDGLFLTLGFAALTVCCWLFFRRRRQFPRVYILVFGVYTGIQIAYTLTIVSLDLGELIAFTNKEIRSLFFSALSYAVWASYFLQSQRVRETFMFPLPDTHSQDITPSDASREPEPSAPTP